MEGGKGEVEGFIDGGQWNRNAKNLRLGPRVILFLHVNPPPPHTLPPSPRQRREYKIPLDKQLHLNKSSERKYKMS